MSSFTASVYHGSAPPALSSGQHTSDIDEPELSEEGRRELPTYTVRHNERAAFSYVLKHLKR